MRILIAGTLALIAASPAAAADLAAMFATRPSVMQAAMSPDGDKVAFISAFKTGGRVVRVADVATGATNIVLGGSDLSVRPFRCEFKTETRLICTVYGIAGTGTSRMNFTRVVAVDTDGRNIRVLGQTDNVRDRAVGDGGGVIDWLPDDPSHVLMTVTEGYRDSNASRISSNNNQGTGGAMVDIRTGTQRTVERNLESTADLGTDNHGKIRFRAAIQSDVSGYMRNRISYLVRPKDKSDWVPLSRSVATDTRATSYDGFDESGDHIYALKSHDGRTALFSVATDGSNAETLIYANPKVDVDGVLRIGKFRRPVAAVYTVESGEYEFFDQKLAALCRSLSRALPGNPAVAVFDESWDGTKKLIYTDNDNVPGRYYIFDTGTKQLVELFPVYPGLDGVKLGSVQAVRFPARDGTPIPGYLTLPPGHTDAKGLPGIVMPHGGPEARDTAGFDWLPQFFAAMGYAVLQPNFRGSTGYGDAFFAENGYKSWPLAIGDVNDSGHWLLAQGVDPKKLGIFGWSYGGYAALQANVVEPTLYHAVVAVAPVTDLAQYREDRRFFTDFTLVDGRMGTGPHIAAGSPDKNAGKIQAPVLIFHADQDMNVDIVQSRLMTSALKSAGKQVEFIEYKGLDHQIDDSVARSDLLAKSAAFLDKALK